MYRQHSKGVRGYETKGLFNSKVAEDAPRCVARFKNGGFCHSELHGIS